MRELAYVQQIKVLKPIPNADSIECAEILGWEVVVKRGDFKVGDLVIYCEIDSILPELPPFEFLRPKKFRIRTVKLRGQISQGIAFPLSVLKDVDPTFNLSSLKVGQDVSSHLKITKYDPEAALDVQHEQVKKSWLQNKISYLKWKLFKIKPVKRDGFPSDVPKTDETRVQKMGGLLEDKVGQPAYITEKCEGSSATFIYRRNGNWLAKLFGNAYTFQVCSRNMVVPPAHYLMKIAESYKILDGLKKLDRNLAVQGESLGPKIQGNIYKLSDYELKVFSIFDLDKRCYLPYNELVDLLSQLNLPMVPVLNDAAIIENDIKYYVELSKGKSRINPDILREGIVIRGLNSEFSFKSINPEYLLKQE